MVNVKFLETSVIRAVATTPEKTPTEKVKFFELRDNHQSIPLQKLSLEKRECGVGYIRNWADPI